MKTYKRHASSFGQAAANLVAVACYVSIMLFWTFGIAVVLLVFLVEKKSGLVRFHAMQAALLWLVRALLGGDIIFESLAAVATGSQAYMMGDQSWAGDLTIILTRLAVGVVITVCCVFALAYAYQWRDWKVPVIGQLARLICRFCAPAVYEGEGPVPEDCRTDHVEETDARRQRLYKAAEIVREEKTVTLADLGLDRSTLAEIASPQVSAQREWRLPETKDANAQLPPDMRDAPSSAGVAAKGDVGFCTSGLPPVPAGLLEYDEVLGGAGLNGATADDAADGGEERRQKAKRSIEEGGHVGLLERVAGRVLGMNRETASIDEDSDDPCHTLPPDMRDEPTPACMRDGPMPADML